MKIQITALLNTSPESADWLLTYSQKALMLLPEIQAVHYENGSEADFGKGAVLTLKGMYKKKNWSSKVEILEYERGKSITQRFSDASSASVMRTTLSRDGHKTLIRTEGEMKLNSSFLAPISPLVARGLKRIYLERFQRLTNHFDPQNQHSPISVQIRVAGLPYQLAYILLLLGAGSAAFLILKAFGV